MRFLLNISKPACWHNCSCHHRLDVLIALEELTVNYHRLAEFGRKPDQGLDHHTRTDSQRRYRSMQPNGPLSVRSGEPSRAGRLPYRSQIHLHCTYSILLVSNLLGMGASSRLSSTAASHSHGRPSLPLKISLGSEKRTRCLWSLCCLPRHSKH
jgi:hypothetical protein